MEDFLGRWKWCPLRTQAIAQGTTAEVVASWACLHNLRHLCVLWPAVLLSLPSHTHIFAANPFYFVSFWAGKIVSWVCTSASCCMWFADSLLISSQFHPGRQRHDEAVLFVGSALDQGAAGSHKLFSTRVEQQEVWEPCTVASLVNPHRRWVWTKMSQKAFPCPTVPQKKGPAGSSPLGNSVCWYPISECFIH